MPPGLLGLKHFGGVSDFPAGRWGRGSRVSSVDMKVRHDERSGFATPAQVREHMERILPGEEARVRCLAIFAESMERLHGRGPSRWGAYCEGDHLRLLGGGLIVLTIKGGRLWLALDQAAIDRLDSTEAIFGAPGVARDPGRWSHYKRPPTTNVFYTPTKENAHAWSSIRGLHFSLLDRVAHHAFRRASRDKHQPAVSVCIGEILGRALPEPNYVTSGEKLEKSVSFRHAEAFPLIAAMILNLAKEHPSRWITHRALVDRFLSDREGAALLERVRAKSSFADDRSTASNMIAWFSERVSVGRSEWAELFERKRPPGQHGSSSIFSRSSSRSKALQANRGPIPSAITSLRPPS